MNNSSLPTQDKLTGAEALAATEAEFETAIREIEARVDRRLLEAAQLRYALTQELASERDRAADQEKELDRLRLELKKMTQAAASAEAKLNVFEQMLEAVEDDIDERIESVEERNADLRSEIARLNEQLEHIKASWSWRATAGFRGPSIKS